MTIPYRRPFMHLVFGVVLAFAVPGCQQEAADDTAGNDTTAASTTADNAANEDAARRFVDEVFNKGNMDFIDSAVTQDFVEQTPSPGQEQGIPGLRKWITEFRTAFPDLNMTVDHVVSEGDMVAMHVRMVGTNTGAMMGMPATNKKLDVRGVDLLRFVDGKASEHWGYYEEMKMMQQLGWAPPPPGTPGAPGANTGGTDTAAGAAGAAGDTTKK